MRATAPGAAMSVALGSVATSTGKAPTLSATSHWQEAFVWRDLSLPHGQSRLHYSKVGWGFGQHLAQVSIYIVVWFGPNFGVYFSSHQQVQGHARL